VQSARALSDTRRARSGRARPGGSAGTCRSDRSSRGLGAVVPTTSWSPRGCGCPRPPETGPPLDSAEVCCAGCAATLRRSKESSSPLRGGSCLHTLHTPVVGGRFFLVNAEFGGRGEPQADVRGVLLRQLVREEHPLGPGQPARRLRGASKSLLRHAAPGQLVVALEPGCQGPVRPPPWPCTVSHPLRSRSRSVAATWHRGSNRIRSMR
jgi:hypothetical protein